MTPSRPLCARRVQLATLALAAGLLLATTGLAVAQDLQGELQSKRSQLEDAQARGGVLTTTIDRYSARIDSLSAEVSALRERQALLETQLEDAQARLDAAIERLVLLQGHLDRAIQALSDGLVQIYKTGEPDTLSVLLNSDGFDDLVTQSAYLSRINRGSQALVARVENLRDQTETLVAAVQSERDQIAARKAELVRARSSLEQRQGELSAVREKNRRALSEVRNTQQGLSEDVEKLQDQIAAQLQSAAGPSIAPGPIKGGANGLIWPIDGPITSTFGPRWGSMHEGIDISAPGGTPIRAAKAGEVVLAAPTGGYGNYTCIDHGGGLSTCYAHQSRFGTSVGASVAQGEVMGYVGTTGHSTGNHLHFEVRINGEAQDPLSYL